MMYAMYRIFYCSEVLCILSLFVAVHLCLLKYSVPIGVMYSIIILFIPIRLWSLVQDLLGGTISPVLWLVS